VDILKKKKKELKEVPGQLRRTISAYFKSNQLNFDCLMGYFFDVSQEDIAYTLISP